MTTKSVRANSAKTKAAKGRNPAKRAKPDKPHPDFPLTAHPRGQWCKKVRGKVHYFGPWEEPDKALEKWLDQKDYLIGGYEVPQSSSDVWRVGTLCDAFLDMKASQVSVGDIAQCTLDDYQDACQRWCDFIGKERPLDSIGPHDFERYRAAFPKTWGPHSVRNEITLLNTCLSYATQVQAIERPIITGPMWTKPSQAKMRRHRAQSPKRLFSAAEIHSMSTAAGPQLRAMILLGINCGFGNVDCARLQISDIDFDLTRMVGHRVKTGIERAAWLWPETIEAIHEAIADRPADLSGELAGHVFVTKYRKKWSREGKGKDAVVAAFAKVRTAALVAPLVTAAVDGGEEETIAKERLSKRWRGVGFYSLRHSFETIAGDSRDQVAVNHVMGHCDHSMAAAYREGIDFQRVIDVCSFVRDWYLKGADA